MRFSYFDDSRITDTAIQKLVGDLKTYRQRVDKIIFSNNDKKPEYALAAHQDSALHDSLDAIRKQFKDISQLVVVGIGGSSLGLEAIHAALGTGKVTLHVLDTVAVSEMQETLQALRRVKDVKKIGICVISKSGGTAETLTNGDVLLSQLEDKFGNKLYKQVVAISDSGTQFATSLKRRGATVCTIPERVGGRFSVSTAAALVPLTMLGHDTDAFIGGLTDANSEEFEEITAHAAGRIALYMEKRFTHYNFFAFEVRLEKLGAWYRQLFAESLGKAATTKKQPVTRGMLPTISTPVELHSIGQLYLSGFSGVYTDFVTFDDLALDYDIQGTVLASQYKKRSLQEISTAIYGGVLGAYQEQQLPYRSLILDDDLAYNLGLFMGMRMREVMYVAKLRDINAFDQPNVESYKKITRKILSV